MDNLRNRTTYHIVHCIDTEHIHTPSPKRLTSQLQAVQAIVTGTADHLTADDVVAHVRKTMPRVSRATVYRNLDTLATGGAIGRVQVNGVAHYERDTTAHYHVRCAACRRLDNIAGPQAVDVEATFARHTPYRLTGHDLILYGLCPRCQRKR